VQQIRRVIEEVIGEGSITARSDGSVHALFPVAIGDAEGRSLGDWVRREHAVRTIEVGLGYGIAALFICEGLLAGGDAEARHLAIDPNQTTRFADCGLQVLAEAGVESLVDFLPQPSELALPRLVEDKRSFDLAFVDGNHRFDGVFVDLIYLGRLVRPGGIVFVDDVQLPSVARAVSFCTTNLEWSVETASTDDDLHHWTVLRAPAVPPQRRFDHFVDFC
jgi:predicted O-methyltransferase YrrM